MFLYRQIIAYKNLIDALEHVSTLMIYTLGFYTNGRLNQADYREFIRVFYLSKEHLISAKHFLQGESVLNDEIELKLSKWYHEFGSIEKISDSQKYYFDNRYDFEAELKNQNGGITKNYLEFIRIYES